MLQDKKTDKRSDTNTVLIDNSDKTGKTGQFNADMKIMNGKNMESVKKRKREGGGGVEERKRESDTST